MLNNYSFTQDLSKIITRETDCTAKIFKNIKKKNSQIIKSNKNNCLAKNIFDNGSQLAIIKSVILEKQVQDIQILETNCDCDFKQIYNLSLSRYILDALTQLADNQQQSKAIKAFISVQINFESYDKMKFIIEYIPKELKLYIIQAFNINIFKQLNDSYKMQLDQQISNVLFFEMQEIQNNIQYNSAFLSAYLMHIQNSKSNNVNSKLKIIFINLTGVNNNDANIYKLFPNDQCLYISLQKYQNAQPQQESNLQSLNQSNFKNIVIQNYDGELTWQKFKIIYKYMIKNYVKSFKSKLFILSVAKQLQNENYLQFSEDCLKNIVKKFSQLAKDRLIIHSQISLRESAEATQTLPDKEKKEIEKKEKEQNIYQLTLFINSLQQGILSKNLLLYDNNINQYQTDQTELINWIQNFLCHNNKIINFYAQEKIQRELRGLMINSQFQLVEEQDLKLGVCIIMKDDLQNYVKNYSINYKIIYLFYQGKSIQFLKNTILYVDYLSKIIVLLQYENQEYFIYFSYYKQQDQNEKDLNCERIQLSYQLEQQNIFLDDSILQNSSLMVSDQNIYIVYNKCGAEIITINTQSQSVFILKRSNLINLNQVNDKFKIKISKQDQTTVQKQIQDRRKPAIVKNNLFSGFNFALFGGEILNSSKICNLVELLQLNSSGFSSIIIPKDCIFDKCNFYIPWPNMIVLVNNQQPSLYVLLPGDYNNKTYCYNQVINKEHQEIAILLTSQKDSQKFQMEKLKIVYQNANLESKEILPIQYFSGNQVNIKHPQNIESPQQWYLAITLLEQTNQIQDCGFSNLIQLFVFAEIQILPQKKELRIKESFERLQCKEVLQKKIVNYHREKQTKYDYKISQRQN